MSTAEGPGHHAMIKRAASTSTSEKQEFRKSLSLDNFSFLDWSRHPPNLSILKSLGFDTFLKASFDEFHF